MNTQLEQAKELLYGRDGLGVTNFKLFPGSNRDKTAEEMAAQVLNAVRDLMADQGDAEAVA